MFTVWRALRFGIEAIMRPTSGAFGAGGVGAIGGAGFSTTSDRMGGGSFGTALGLMEELSRKTMVRGAVARDRALADGGVTEDEVG